MHLNLEKTSNISKSKCLRSVVKYFMSVSYISCIIILDGTDTQFEVINQAEQTQGRIWNH